MKLFEIFGKVIIDHNKWTRTGKIDQKAGGLAGTLGKAEESIGATGSTLTKIRDTYRFTSTTNVY